VVEEVRSVAVPAARVGRWVENFAGRHGETSLVVEEGTLAGRAPDGSTFRARLPFATPYDGPAEVGELVDAVRPPGRWGVLLVRKGGFAVARMTGAEIAEHKIGQRHVQGRTKAGGQSQQRFARRRVNQARQAYEAAAEHAARILGGAAVLVVTGGDHAAVDEVLTDPRLRHLIVTEPWLAVPDPRRSVLDHAVAEAMSVRIEVRNA
jgi:Actinobacteria/chloroflexi VLRF1 release factor